MKSLNRFLGIILIGAVIGVTMAACGGDDDDDRGLEGTVSTPPSSPDNAPAGVYVPATGADVGKLVISAPAYTINPTTGAVISTSDAVSVTAQIRTGSGTDGTTIVNNGTISGGTLAITIPEANGSLLKPAVDFFGDFLMIPPKLFQSGQDVKIGELCISPSGGLMLLFSNPVFKMRLHNSQEWWELPDEQYFYFYSEGTITISGSHTEVHNGITNTVKTDLKLVKGWNCVYQAYKMTGTTAATYTMITKIPPAATAKWVFVSKSLGVLL